MKHLTDEDFENFEEEQESQFITEPAEFEKEVNDRILGLHGNFGDRCPWSKTHGKLAFRPKELSIWAGINGHGKSQMLGMVGAWWIQQGKKVLVASLEMPPASTLHRMARQCSGVEQPTSEWVHKWLEQLKDKLFIYDQTDTVEPDRVLAMVRYAAAKLGVDHIIIDSLVKCGIDYGNNQLKEQKEFIDRLAWLVKKYGIHIHLVHHMRKGESEEKTPGKFEVKGAGEITDLADNVLIVHRNKRKENAVRTMKADDPRRVEVEEQYDQTLTVAKQRHGEWEGVFGFYYLHNSMQYSSKKQRLPWGGSEDDEVEVKVEPVVAKVAGEVVNGLRENVVNGRKFPSQPVYANPNNPESPTWKKAVPKEFDDDIPF